jgi:hypothetical protein
VYLARCASNHSSSNQNLRQLGRAVNATKIFSKDQ